MRGSDRPILDAAIALIAEVGIRGAALRKIGERAGVHFTNLSRKYGSKESLIAECFTEVVQRDLSRFRNMIDDCLRLELDDDAILHLLWVSCDDYGSELRSEGMVLIELLLASESDERYADICREWLRTRRDYLRELCLCLDIEPVVTDTLSIMLLSEITYSPGCHQSISYRLISRYGLIAAYSYLTNQNGKWDIARQNGLIEQFYLSPPPAEDPDLAPRPRRGDETVTKIVEAAASIIEEKGIQGITHRSVAERTGVSTPLINYYFKNISELSHSALLIIFDNARSIALAYNYNIEVFKEYIARRAIPAEMPRGYERIYRGMLELSLAGARSETQQNLALLTRQQMGAIPFARLDQQKPRAEMRMRTAAYGLWGYSIQVLMPLFANCNEGWDFDAQSRLAFARLLNVAEK